MPAPYPVFLHLDGRPVLIVGGGRVATRKAKGLVAAGACVTVVSPAFGDELAGLSGLSERVEAAYGTAHMAQREWTLVFAATDIPAVNAQVHVDAAARRVPCCRCDDTDLGDFSGGATASVGERGAVTLAISTAGASPVLSSRIAKLAAGAIDPVLANLAKLMAEWRPQIKEAISDPTVRLALLKQLAGAEMEAVLRTEGEAGAQERFRTLVLQTNHSTI